MLYVELWLHVNQTCICIYMECQAVVFLSCIMQLFGSCHWLYVNLIKQPRCPALQGLFGPPFVSLAACWLQVSSTILCNARVILAAGHSAWPSQLASLALGIFSSEHISTARACTVRSMLETHCILNLLRLLRVYGCMSA